MSGAIICFECVGQRMGVGFSKYGGAAGAGARIAFFVLDVVLVVLEVALSEIEVHGVQRHQLWDQLSFIL